TQGITVRLEELVGDGERATCRQHVTGSGSDVRAQSPFAVSRLGTADFDLALGDSHASVLPSVEVQRDGHSDAEIVVRADRFLSAQFQHRVRPQGGLPYPSGRRVELGTRATD